MGKGTSTAIVPFEPKRPKRGEAAVEEVLRLAASCNLLGPLGVHTGLNGSPFAQSLLERSQRRAVEVWDIPRAHSALTWLTGFLAATGITVPFWFAFGSCALAAAGRLHNRAFLDSFVEFICDSPAIGSSRSGHVSADVAQGYGGVVRTIRCCEARYDIAPEEDNFVAPRALRHVRRSEPPRGERVLSLGLGAEDLQLAAAAGFDRTSPQGEIEWGAATNALMLLLRGGEVGTRDNPLESDFRRMLIAASYLWQPRRAGASGRLWLMVLVYAIKDVEARGRPCPGPIGRHHDGPLGADPLCAYDAAAIVWWRHMAATGAPFPVDQHGAPADDWWLRADASFGAFDASFHTQCRHVRPASQGCRCQQPMFTTVGSNGRRVPFTTRSVTQLGRRIIQLARPSANILQYGGKMWRVGGATEWRRTLGDGSEAVIQKRGRWCTEIGRIYTRTLLAEQLRASMLIGTGGDGQEELEALAGGWTQSA